MADLTSTAAQLAPTGHDCVMKPYTAAVDLTAGQWVYLNSSGKLALARANGVSTSYVLGVVSRTVKAGQTVSVIRKGRVAGIDVSGMAYNANVFLSAATAGAIADAAASGTGNVVVPIGRVDCINEGPTPVKVLYVDVPFNTVLAALP